MKKFGVPVVVAINHFLTDTDEEIEVLENYCRENDVEFALSDVFAKGGEGGKELAEKVVKACEKPANFAPIYSLDLSIKEKIETIAKEIYGADGVDYSAAASKAIADIEKLGYSKLPVCMAKTQYSLSDDANKLGRPSGFRINIREVKVSAGAGFVVALAGAIPEYYFLDDNAYEGSCKLSSVDGFGMLSFRELDAQREKLGVQVLFDCHDERLIQNPETKEIVGAYTMIGSEEKTQGRHHDHGRLRVQRGLPRQVPGRLHPPHLLQGRDCGLLHSHHGRRLARD